MNASSILIWYHTCHGRLGIFNSVETLIKAMQKAPYPLPDTTKMIERLHSNCQYQYAIGLLKVKSVPADTDLDKLEL